MSNLCACESGLAFKDCCQPILTGDPAPSPEALMRSRYTAYTLADTAYLLKSWHPTTRPASVELNPDQRWLGLKIKDTSNTEAEGYVEFVARFKIGGKGHRLHERSRFIKDGAEWFYFDGELQPSSR